MDNSTPKKYVLEMLDAAGVVPNGKNPWDVQVHNPQLYDRVMNGGSLGLGEAYMDGWWDCQRLDQLFERLMKASVEGKLKPNKFFLFKLAIHKFLNFQTKTLSLVVGKQHYDLGNDLFKCMLDSRMNYTCGYWRDASNLEKAQLHKLELTCQKLMLKPGMKILDIGCGFGALAKFAAENYGVSVVGVTISQKQRGYAQENCAGLPVDIRFQDYRDVKEKFDRIVSLGMFEHVGHLNYRPYMQIVQHCLEDEGLFLLHTIGNNISLFSADPWISKYIFPNGMIPSIAQISSSAEGLFIMEDWHNFGADYDKTLMAWDDNVEKNWQQLKEKYNEHFYRMWRYYLLSCAGIFRARELQLWQIVFSKQGVQGGYQVPRLDFKKNRLDESVDAAVNPSRDCQEAVT